MGWNCCRKPEPGVQIEQSEIINMLFKYLWPTLSKDLLNNLRRREISVGLKDYRLVILPGGTLANLELTIRDAIGRTPAQDVLQVNCRARLTGKPKIRARLDTDSKVLPDVDVELRSLKIDLGLELFLRGGVETLTIANMGKPEVDIDIEIDIGKSGISLPFGLEDVLINKAVKGLLAEFTQESPLEIDLSDPFPQAEEMLELIVLLPTEKLVAAKEHFKTNETPSQTILTEKAGFRSELMSALNLTTVKDLTLAQFLWVTAVHESTPTEK